jgi:hypothetical protein
LIWWLFLCRGFESGDIASGLSGTGMYTPLEIGSPTRQRSPIAEEALTLWTCSDALPPGLCKKRATEVAHLHPVGTHNDLDVLQANIEQQGQLPIGSEDCRYTVRRPETMLMMNTISAITKSR